MNITELTFRLLLLFFPGIICFYIVDALTVHKPRRAYEVFLFAYVFGLLSYGVYALVRGGVIVVRGIGMTTDSTEFRAPVPDNIGFAKSLTDANSQINFSEIILVSLVAFVLAMLISIVINRKWLFDIAKKLHITRKFGDPDVWAFAFNTKEVSWATVRDLEHNLMFAGYIQAYSDVEENAELFLSDVIVYNDRAIAP